MVRTAKTASVMRPTYPENAPDGEERRYERLYPRLYPLHAFIPFVNLHQEHYLVAGCGRLGLVPISRNTPEALQPGRGLLSVGASNRGVDLKCHRRFGRDWFDEEWLPAR